MIKVSVLINTYNHGDLLSEAIESALAQDCNSDEIEIIVADDGSTDDTPQRLRHYGDVLTVLHLKNGGQANAYNAAIKEARGEYLVFLDGDDRMLPNRCSRIIEAFKDPDVVLVLNARQFVTDKGVHTETLQSEEFTARLLCEDSLSAFVRMGYGSSRTAVRKSALGALGPIPEGYPINADIMLMTLVFYGRVSSLKEALTEYRIHDNNLFHSGSVEKEGQTLSSLEFYLAAFRAAARKGPYYTESFLQALSAQYTWYIEERRLRMLSQSGGARRSDMIRYLCAVWDTYCLEWTAAQCLLFLIKSVARVLLGPRAV